jgi:hypothetical protein
MKKLMKAIAFATVMCMLLSTVAFAAQEATVNSAKNGINVTVEAEEGTQVALLILAKGTALKDAASGNILFIDQKPAAASGATFTDVSIGSAKAADVFVGYEGNKTVALGTVTFEAGDTITVTTVKKFESVDGQSDNDLGGGYLLNLVKDLDEGRSLKNLIWAIDWTKKVEGEDAVEGTSYIAVGAEELAEINLLGGNTYIGVAFSAGAKKVNPYDVELGEIRAIWRTAGGELPDKESVVADKDAANKSN